MTSYDPTPNLGLDRPPDNNRNWGDSYRDAMTKIDLAIGAMQVASGQMLLDYGSRTDGSPVYLGKALPGTPTSANAWTVTKFLWESGADGAPLMGTLVQHDIAWDDRADGWPS